MSKGSRKSSSRESGAVPVRRMVVRRRKRVRRPNAEAQRARIAIYAVGTLLAIGLIAHTASGFMRDMPYLQLARLQVNGVSTRIEGDLQALLEKVLSGNRNLLTMDIGRIGRAIQSHPRIRDLQLQKVYPDTLVITASERHPEAVVIADGFYLVDRDGMVIEKVKPAELRTHDLPYLTGIPADEVKVGEKVYQASLYRSLDMIRILRERAPELYARFSEVHIERDPITHLDNLTARLTGGMEVRFGDTNPIERLPLFEVFIEEMKKQNQDPFNMRYLDLRFKNQLVFMDNATAMARGNEELLANPDRNIEEMLRENRERLTPTQKPSTTGRSSRPSSGSTPPVPRREIPMAREAFQSIPTGSAPAPPSAQPAQTERRGIDRLKFWKRDSDAPAQPAAPAPRLRDRIPNPFGGR